MLYYGFRTENLRLFEKHLRTPGVVFGAKNIFQEAIHMKKILKKALSVVLCVLIAFSTVTLSFAADDGEKKPSLGTQYFLSTSNTENSKFVLDFLDEILQKENYYNKVVIIKKTLLTPEVYLEIDFRSVNGVCKTIDTLSEIFNNKLVSAAAKFALGDIGKLDLSKWKTKLQRGAKDAEIIYNVLDLLGANAKLISKVVDGSINLGVLDAVVNLEDILGKDGVSGMVKDLLVGLIYDKNSDPDGYSAAYQKALKDFDAFIFDDLIPKLMDEHLPGLVLGKGITVDRLFSTVLDCGWKDYFIEDIKSIKIEAKGEALEKLSEIMVFDGETIDTDNLPLDVSKGLKDQLNNIHGYVICQFFPHFTGWVNGSDIKLLGQNYSRFLKYVSKHFFSNENAKPVDILKYILNSVAAENSSDEEIKAYADAVSKCKDLSEALKVVLILAAKKNEIPVNEKAASYENVLGDYLAYAANKIFDLGYGPGTGKNVWTVANDVLNVVLFDKGFAKALNLNVKKTDSCFEKFDKIVGTTKIWNMTASKKQYKSEEFFKGFLNAVLNFDLEKAFDLVVVRFSDDFGKANISVLLYNMVYNFLENWFGTPAIVKCDTKAPFQTGFSNKSLQVPVEKVLTKLSEKKTTIVPPFLYVAAAVIEKTSKNPTEANITAVTIANQTYTGKAIIPSSVTVTVNGKKVSIPKHQFTAELKNNVNIGTASAVIHLDGAVRNADVNVSFKIVPGKVSGLKATPGKNSISLSWNKVLGAKGYSVEYYNGSKWVSKTVTSNSASIASLKAGTAYKIRVRAVSGSFFGEYSSLISASTKVAKIAAVKTKARTASSITLYWSKVAGAKKYEVQILKNKKWVTVRTVTENSITVGKNYISANRAYRFRVRALGASAALNGDYSDPVVAYSGLARITKVNAKAKKNAVTLAWQKIAGAQSYEVQIQRGNKWVTVATVKKPAAAIGNNQLKKAKMTFKPNTVYKFRVRAAKTVSKVKVYSVYSPVIKVRTAKK